MPLIAAERVGNDPIPLSQGGIAKTTEWFPYMEELVFQEGKIHITEYGAGGFRLSDWFTTNEMFCDWRAISR